MTGRSPRLGPRVFPQPARHGTDEAFALRIKGELSGSYPAKALAKTKADETAARFADLEHSDTSGSASLAGLITDYLKEVTPTKGQVKQDHDRRAARIWRAFFDAQPEPERHFDRARSAYPRINASPSGAAIMTGSNFALNRERTAELLGFDSVLPNTFDAIQSHDDEFDTIAVGAGVTLSLARWSNDINFWSGQEAGYVRIPDRFCGTSSRSTSLRAIP